MTLFAEFHLIQSFAPSNLNRDDTGAPKDAVFGGHRRARVSSQCFKRSVRLHVGQQGTLAPAALGVRTKKLQQLLVAALAERGLTNAEERIAVALEAAGLTLDDKGATQYLLFLGRGEVQALADMIHTHWDALAPAASAPADPGKRTKKQAKAAAPDEVKKAVKRLLDGGKAVDVALFGRMLADLPEANQHAACQVAHALSTHRVEREFDYFTAVDDEGGADETGAGMIGHVEFNAATFYRYAVVDVHKLVSNLQGDSALALQGLAAFAEGLARALPTGKQNSFAAHNPPSFVGVVLRHGSPLNLCNAFERPVAPKPHQRLTELSVAAMAEHEMRMAAFYGDSRDRWAVLDDTGAWPAAQGAAQTSLAALVQWLREQVQPLLPASRPVAIAEG
ncbi:MAG: type I-E CRISPR-associated protein Cas7/Cse4/CasC [Rubrivivax sp.]|nr:type I-E CRISPR-associated protein Cas7/Cse4/CasC [Rubrivivax sp.]